MNAHHLTRMVERARLSVGTHPRLALIEWGISRRNMTTPRNVNTIVKTTLSHYFGCFINDFLVTRYNQTIQSKFSNYVSRTAVYLVYDFRKHDVGTNDQWTIADILQEIANTMYSVHVVMLKKLTNAIFF